MKNAIFKHTKQCITQVFLIAVSLEHFSLALLTLDLTAPVELAVTILLRLAHQGIVPAPTAHDITPVRPRTSPVTHPPARPEDSIFGVIITIIW